MKNVIHILHLEDDPVDAELIQARLMTTEFDYWINLVRTRHEFEAAIGNDEIDLILADYRLPGYDGLSALKLVREQRPDLPFIFVSGALGEESAIGALTQGATDYVLKENLTRLETAISRALEEADNRRQRRQAVAALKASEARYIDLYEHAPDMYMSVNFQTALVDTCNQTLADMLGRPKEEIIGRPVTEIFHPNFLEQAQKVFKEFQTLGKVQDKELQLRKKDSSRLDVSLNASAVRGEDGIILFCRCTLRDISDRKLNSKINAARMRLMQFAVSHSLDELLEETVNAAEMLTDSLIGFFAGVEEDKQSLILQHWSTRTKEKFCKAQGKGLHYAIADAGVWVDAYHQRKPVIHNDYNSLPHRKGLPKGHAEVIRELVVPVFRQDRIKALLGVGNKANDYTERDVEALTSLANLVWEITERKQAEEALREGERQKDLILNATVEMVTYYDLDLNIIWANRAAAESIGKSPAELVGLHCHEIWHQCEKPCVGCPLVQARNDKAPRQGEVRNPAGRYWLVRGFPIFDETMQVTALVGFAQDITERKQIEQEREKIQGQLLQAQKMEAIGTLSGGIAHDFNNILSPIIGFSEIALGTIPRDNPAASDIQEVLKAGHRAKDLVKQILILSRQAEQEIQPLKIQFIIKEVLKLLRATIPTTIQIRQNVNPECGAILADPTQIHQIVMNLCTNAYHAMRETGGVLGLALTPVALGPDGLITTNRDLQPGLYVQLEVSDTGHGMDKIVLERIFDPYYTTKAKGEGTGLGLSIVHGIVKSLHGDISVYSEPGKGSTFRVYFPVVEAGGGKKDDTAVAGQLPTGNEHILFVDDEEVIVQMEQQMLESLGYQVSSFSDVEEALKTYRAQPDSFDLIITDMTMPKITGLQLTKEVLAVRPDIPVILCTGFSELINEEKAREAGIRKYLIKPVLRKDLAEAVRKVLDEQTSK